MVDPTRTVAAGKVEIGAFRTYPNGYKPPDEGPSEYQTIPLSKIEDFGVHAKSYYPLDITTFKSSLDSTLLDLLWCAPPAALCCEGQGVKRGGEPLAPERK